WHYLLRWIMRLPSPSYTLEVCRHPLHFFPSDWPRRGFSQDHAARGYRLCRYSIATSELRSEPASGLRIECVCPFEVEPNSHFVTNPQGQTLLCPQPNGRAVECDYNLKLASDPFMGLNSNRDVLQIVCASQRYVMSRQGNLNVLIAEAFEQTG